MRIHPARIIRTRHPGPASPGRSPLSRGRLSILIAGALLVAIGGRQEAAAPGGDAGGFIAANFTATPSGAAAFQVPIQVAPGIGGLQPTLSLNYNSQSSANGTTGIAWSLGGASAIHRCARTRAVDGVSGGIDYTIGDRLCKDGQRLIARLNYSNHADYWFGNSYSTEIEEWSETIATGGNCGAGPCSFETRHANGRIAIYGGTGDSRVLTARATGGARQIRQWLVSEIRDASGNALRFHYTSGGANTAVIDRIEYDGRGVQFTYDNRGVRDQLIAYDGTGRTTLSKRLREIRVSTASGVFKSYRLNYEGDPLSARSRLTQINECDANGSCMDPITVVWSGPGGPDGSFRISIPGGGQYQGSLRYDPGAKIIPGDFNGDGKTDFIRQEKGKSDDDYTNSFRVYMSRGDGRFDVHQPGTNRQYDQYQDWLRHDPGVNILTGDFNGDGKTDFLRQEKGGWGKDNKRTFHVYFSRGDGTFDIRKPGLDRSGDRFQHWLRADPGAVLTLGDFNGDGKTDFIRQEKGDWGNDNTDTFQVYLSRGDGNFDIRYPGRNQSGDPYQHHLRYDPGALLIPGDYNGDGKTDFIRQEKGNWGNDTSGTFRVYLSKGDGNFRIITPSGDYLQADLRLNKGARLTPADINGDGKTDLLAQGAYIWDPPGDRTFFRALISRGDGNFDKVSNWRQGYKHNGWLQSDWSNLIPIDYNGDGRADFIRQISGEKRNDSKDAFQVYVSRGDGFFDLKDPGGWYYEEGLRDNSSEGGANIIVGDFDGDGRGDFIRQEKGAWDDDTNYSFGVFFAAKNADNLRYSTVAAINQGPIVHRFGYRRLSHQNMNAGMSFPAGHRGFRSPLNVLSVYERRVPTGAPGSVHEQSVRQTYEFRGATLHKDGRGFRGFQRMTVTSPAEGILTVSEFHVAFPLTGHVKRTDTYTANGATRLAESHFSFEGASGTISRTRHPRLTRHIEKRHYADGVYQNTNTLQYDSLGNPVLATETDGGRTVQTCASFKNDIANKRPGLAERIIQGTSCSVSGDSCACTERLTEVRNEYDDRRNLIQRRTYDDTSDAWLIQDFEYDVYGNRTRAVRAGGVVTTTSYDSTYNTYPSEITTSADGRTFVETQEYDARHGERTVRTDANEHSEIREYDGFGRLTKLHRAGPQGSTPVENRSYARRADGLYETVATHHGDWDGTVRTVRTIISDALGRDLEEITGTGGDAIVQSRRYDPAGRLTRQSLAERRNRTRQWIDYSYNGRGQMSTVSHPTGMRVALSHGVGGACENNQLRSTAIATGGSGDGTRNTTRCKNARGKLERLVLSDPGSGRSTTQDFSFDALDRLVEANDGQSSTAIELDSLGRRKRIDNSDRGVTTFEYNPRGLLSAEIHNGQRKSFQYDGRERPTRIDFHDGSYASFAYDAASIANAKGRMTRASRHTADGAESARREYAYDAAGNATTMKLTVGGESYTIGYVKDPRGRTQEIHFPGGRRACYTYNAEGALAGIARAEDTCDGPDATNIANYAGFTAVGRPGRVEYGNGVVAENSYDAYNRLNVATVTGKSDDGEDQTFLDQDYDWTTLEELDRILDRAGDKDADFEYDGFGYLTRATGAYGDLRYEYDPRGNLVRKAGVEIFYEDANGPGRASGDDTGLSLQYDVHGNVIRRTKGDGTVFEFEYDGAQKIKTITRSGLRAGTYEYDAGEQRVRKIDGAGIQTIYVTADLEIVRYPGGRTLITEYVSGPTGRVAAVTRETSASAAAIGAQNAATHRLQAQMYDPTSIAGLAGWLHHTGAAFVYNPSHAVAAVTVRALLWAIVTTAAILAFAWLCFRTAHNRGITGRLRMRLADLLADLQWLRPATAHALAIGGGPADAYHRRRRQLLWPTPVLVASMLAFSLQCGANGGGDTALLIAPASSEFFPFEESALGPGTNGYGYAEPGTYYFQQDQVGSTSLVTDGEGQVVSCTVYKPYGEVDQNASFGRDIYRSKFNGNEWDRDGEMYYFNARYYDPALGRFLQADDLMLGSRTESAAALNRYAFSGNNPAMNADPGGNLFILAAMGVAGLIGALISASIYMVTAMITGNFSWEELGIEIAIGFGAGLLGGGVGGALLKFTQIPVKVAQATGAAIESLAGSLAAQYAFDGEPDPGRTILDTLVGTAGGALQVRHRQLQRTTEGSRRASTASDNLFPELNRSRIVDIDGESITARMGRISDAGDDANRSLLTRMDQGWDAILKRHNHMLDAVDDVAKVRLPGRVYRVLDDKKLGSHAYEVLLGNLLAMPIEGAYGTYNVE